MLLNSGSSQAHYSQVQVEGNASVSSSFELVCMLHDRLLETLGNMTQAIDRGDIEAKSAAADKCIKILSGLDASLDLESGFELVNNIHQLYQFSMATIAECSASRDIDKLKKVEGIITELKQGWEGALEAYE
ncbi:flagellar export chaperone FliS [Vibrio owensii]|uniref:flagellar export chaperone FliS n=1 Tax=Vibrio owensii TaxID=696485 RepID=UPI0018F1AAF3|nr:flagellar export chaperone FliS [Vibrio owensii]